MLGQACFKHAKTQDQLRHVGAFHVAPQRGTRGHVNNWKTSSQTDRQFQRRTSMAATPPPAHSCSDSREFSDCFHLQPRIPNNICIPYLVLIFAFPPHLFKNSLGSLSFLSQIYTSYYSNTLTFHCQHILKCYTLHFLLYLTNNRRRGFGQSVISASSRPVNIPLSPQRKKSGSILCIFLQLSDFFTNPDSKLTKNCTIKKEKLASKTFFYYIQTNTGAFFDQVQCVGVLTQFCNSRCSVIEILFYSQAAYLFYILLFVNNCFQLIVFTTLTNI